MRLFRDVSTISHLLELFESIPEEKRGLTWVTERYRYRNSDPEYPLPKELRSEKRVRAYYFFLENSGEKDREVNNGIARRFDYHETGSNAFAAQDSDRRYGVANPQNIAISKEFRFKK